ncbi:PTS system transcriptional activator [Pelosinus sp. UFO1]|nr:sigma 54-interacting transcriptional regulator [Pelosinus sp. UFO1]AIF53482.1 PTS system transcriptional activator [Pelosinus sp. UFO1]
MVKRKLRSIILKEDKKEPLTDMQLGEKLLVSREYITSLRKELDILDSRDRKKRYICEEIVQLLQSNKTLSYREITSTIKARGYKLSRYLVVKYLEEIKEVNNNQCEIQRDVIPKETKDNHPENLKYISFKNLVGESGSLEIQIQQAKAAVLYPPNGLHCLILGETGVGKSELAEAMYKFSVESGRLTKDSPFIVFNCADYAENPQLLISHLFGSLKGAYTGALSDRKGLIEQADGGILFLDEVHRLTSEGQEMLFQLIDKGCFRRLGESDCTRQAQVQLIAATTENIETSLLATFKRRIPMIIEVPSLNKRPLNERLKLIKNFFGYESTRMNAPIHVSLDVMKSYLLYECFGNIGQLKSDIQVACAKSFLTYVMEKEECVKIDVRDLNLHVKKGLMKINSMRTDIESLVWQDFKFSPKQYNKMVEIENDLYSFPKEFYSDIEKTYTEYAKQGLNTEEINQIIGIEIERKLQNVIKHVKDNLHPLSTDEIAKVVGVEIISLVEELLKLAENSLGEMDPSIFYCLAIHLNATFNRVKQGREIINPNLDEIKRKYSIEYAVALEMVQHIKKYYGTILPEDEVGFIALYLRGNKQEEEAKVGIVIVTHGYVSIGMLEIANKLLNMNHGKAVVMTLEENPSDVLERLTTVVEEADEGKGIVMLVDMGSLLTLGEMISEKTGIHIETIDRVDTVMVIEAIRRSILPGATSKDVVYAVENLNYTFKKARVDSRVLKRKKAIITVCLTGEGVALQCGSHLKKIFGEKLNNIELIHMGVIGKRDLHKQIQETISTYEIIAIIGSIDPKYHGIPFISLEALFNQSGKNQMISLIEHHNKQGGMITHRGLIPKVVKDAKCIMLTEEHDKKQVLKNICNTLLQEGYVRAGYYEAVMERENMGSYIINQKVALPHADSSYVNHPVIVVAKTAKPIFWDDDNKVSLICLLALDIDGKDGVRFLFNKFNNEKFTTQIGQMQTEEDIREALLNELY